MSAPRLRPAARPCPSCPYRRDVPSGIWAASEYEKLPLYDVDTQYQPTGVFMCHQADGHLCAGWAGCHDGDNLLALRIALAQGRMTVDDVEATVGYRSPVPLFESGSAAAAHGLAELDVPGERARAMMAKLVRQRPEVARDGVRP